MHVGQRERDWARIQCKTIRFWVCPLCNEIIVADPQEKAGSRVDCKCCGVGIILRA